MPKKPFGNIPAKGLVQASSVHATNLWLFLVHIYCANHPAYRTFSPLKVIVGKQACRLLLDDELS